MRRFVNQARRAPARAQPPRFGQFAAQRLDLRTDAQLLQFGDVGIVHTDGDGIFSARQPIGELTIVAGQAQILSQQGADKLLAQLTRPQGDPPIAGAIDLFVKLPAGIDAARLAAESFGTDGVFSLEIFEKKLNFTVVSVAKMLLQISSTEKILSS